MPSLYLLTFHMPMSSPHKIRIFGCFVAIVFEILLLFCVESGHVNVSALVS